MSAGPQHALQRGIVAIELALILVLGIAMLPAMVLLGRVFWHYAAIEKAAHDAAHYLATLPPAEMSNPDNAYAAAATAEAMVIAAAADAQLNPLPKTRNMTVLCDGLTCGASATLPTTIRLVVNLQIDDDLFADLSVQLLGTSSYSFVVDVTERYEN